MDMKSSNAGWQRPWQQWTQTEWMDFYFRLCIWKYIAPGTTWANEINLFWIMLLIQNWFLGQLTTSQARYQCAMDAPFVHEYNTDMGFTEDEPWNYLPLNKCPPLSAISNPWWGLIFAEPESFPSDVWRQSWPKWSNAEICRLSAHNPRFGEEAVTWI